MYLLLILHALFINVIGESCTTPSGTPGKCVSLRSCSSLLWSFTNVKNGRNDDLKKFICSNGKLGLIVCCHVESDLFIFENDEDNTDPDGVTDLKKLTNVNDCGVSFNSVINNGIIRLQDFPWLVKIMTVENQNKKDRSKNVGCTGVLINELYVLYSAQCHYSILDWRPIYVEIKNYNPRAGCDTTSYSPKCSYHENYEAIEYMAHPFYDGHTKLNDIAIIRLSRRIHKSVYLRPICLPISSQPIKVGQTLQTAGWNRTYGINDVSVKKSESSIVISNLECESHNHISISPYEMCTRTNGNIFDSDVIGVPLMSLQGNHWYIQGFESQGDNTKVYTRVQNYLQWIQKAMGGERCLTPYNETGEARELGYCRRLLDAYANVHPNDEEALREFIWWHPNDDVEDVKYILKVCCGLKPNFTIPVETVDKKLDSNVSDFTHCGFQHRDDYILNSEEVSVDEFPWLAVIMNATVPNQRQALCGGSLITERYVLTSAQCVTKFWDTDIALVRLGDYNLRNASDCVKLSTLDLYDCNEIQEFYLDKDIIHPFYNMYTYINDIALFRLDRRVMFTDYVRPICLPRSEDDLGTYGDAMFSTGFGDINRNFAGPEVKKKIPTTLISNEECREKLKMHSYILPVTPYHICTEDHINSTNVICEGDEGGPIMISIKQRWFIVGLSGSYKCGDHEPQIHVNVYKYLKWIKLNVEN